MFVGMTWGMVLSVALYRSYFFLRNRSGSRNGNRSGNDNLESPNT
jgi:hypothetical protein